ncbi:hypothetical protein [Bdellovibrio sp. HCB337]|uniref:hypothetical protein n=1 Tax=Bdellovibrio sp. HCB337 TaxID=3394358 RepID=UPI0039A48932
MRFAIFVLSTLFSFSAFANFTGLWAGKGHMVDGNGAIQQCKNASLELSHTDTNFNLTIGVFECEYLKMTWSPLSLEIKDGELLSNGVSLGNISEDFLYARQQNSENGSIAVYQAEISEVGLNFKETLMDAEGNIILSVEADLVKQ